MKKPIIVIVIAATLAGCATGPYRPIVDTKGVSMEQYNRDLQECQAYSAQTPGAVDSAANNAVAGALLGLVLGAIAGGGIQNRMAGIGAITGGVRGAVDGDNSQKSVVQRCMAGRGYSVLG